MPRLIGALKFEKARARVAYILGQIGPAAVPATEELAKLIADKNPRVSEEAVLALAKIGPGAKAAVPALTKAFQGGEGADDHAIAYALGKIGPDAAAAEPALIAALGSSDNSLAVVSAWALGQIRPGSAELAAKTVPVLIAGLRPPLPQSRQAAAEALGSLGHLAAAAVAGAGEGTQRSGRERAACRRRRPEVDRRAGGPAAPPSPLQASARN